MHWRLGTDVSWNLCKEPAWLLLEAFASCGSCRAPGLALCQSPSSRSLLQGCLGSLCAGLALIHQCLFWLSVSCESSCPVSRPVCYPELGLGSGAMARPLNTWYLRSVFILYTWLMVQVGWDRSRNWGWACVCCNFTSLGPVCTETPLVSLED